jgi:hypothetical protein
LVLWLALSGSDTGRNREQIPEFESSGPLYFARSLLPSIS